MNLNNKLKVLDISSYDNKKFLIVFIVVFSVLVFDLGLSKFTDLVHDQITSIPAILLFVLITSIGIYGQYYFYVKVRGIYGESKFRPSHAVGLDIIVGIINYILISINLIIIFQILTSFSYSTVLLILNGTLSYGIAALLLGILSKRFLTWFINRKSIVVLLYGLATAAISINAVITIVYFDTILINKSEAYGRGFMDVLKSNVNDKTPLSIRYNYTSYDIRGTIGQVLLDSETHSVDVYFVLTWIATAVLLLYNVKRIGKIKYWLLFSLALVYFFSYYASPIDLFQPESSNESTQVVVFYLLFATYSVSIGGLLFGIGFWLLSKSIKIENKIRIYMIIVAISFLLFFNVGEATISQTSFPPFGLANVSFVAISSYLMLTGLSFSALSVSKDVQLRKYIKNYATENSKLFGNIGMAEAESELTKKVTYFTKRSEKLLNEENEIEVSLSDDEIKQYIAEAVEEVKKNKESGRDLHSRFESVLFWDSPYS